MDDTKRWLGEYDEGNSVDVLLHGRGEEPEAWCDGHVTTVDIESGMLVVLVRVRGIVLVQSPELVRRTWTAREMEAEMRKRRSHFWSSPGEQSVRVKVSTWHDNREGLEAHGATLDEAFTLALRKLDARRD